MNDVSRDANWLDETEMRAWRSYVVATLRLRAQLHRELVESYELSLSDYEVLVCISMSPDRQIRMTDLANLLGSTKSRLSHQVSRMELAGLVQRISDSDDRRCVVAGLTEEGQAILDRAAPTHVEGVRTHLIGLLSQEEKLTLDAVFSRVLEHLETGETRAACSQLNDRRYPQ